MFGWVQVLSMDQQMSPLLWTKKWKIRDETTTFYKKYCLNFAAQEAPVSMFDSFNISAVDKNDELFSSVPSILN